MTDDAAVRLREAAARAIRRFAADTGDPFRIDHTVQVTSFGGSGTTALVAHLLDAGVDLQKGPAQWPFKHRRVPPPAADVPDGFRVVYVVGDPRDAVLSIFRRGIQVGHYEALHEASPPPAVATRLATIEDFLAGGVDEFDLAGHLDAWMHHPPGYPVMVVRYDDLLVAWPEIRPFVGLAADHPALAVRERRSDWRSAPGPVRDGLDTLYGELAARIESFPPVQVV